VTGPSSCGNCGALGGVGSRGVLGGVLFQDMRMGFSGHRNGAGRAVPAGAWRRV
jgi:hypothetical protein